MKQKRKEGLAYICVLSAATLWGAIGISVRYIAEFGLSSIQTACFRIFVTTFSLFLYILLTDASKFRIQICDLKYFFGSGILSILLNNVCYAVSVQLNSLSTAAILLYTSPFIVVLLAHICFKEKLTVQKVIALTIGFGGCILTIGLGMFTENALTFVGLIAGIGSALGYALYNLFTKVLVKKYHTLTVAFYTFLLAFIGVLFFSSPLQIVEKVAQIPGRIPFAVLSAALTSALPYLLFPVALRHMESGKASIVATFEVAASSIFGFILYQEKLEVMNLVGILLIVVAIVILNIPNKMSNNTNSIDKKK